MSVKILYAVTSLHVGLGASVGAVGLPVAREPHTGWPYLPGSGIKGALRSRAVFLGTPQPDVEAVFGAEAGDELRRGAVSFYGATLLAMPVRSLRGGALLLTSPLALARFGREVTQARIVGGQRSSVAALPDLPSPGLDVIAMAPSQRTYYSQDGVAFVEDMDLVCVSSPEVHAWSEVLQEWLVGITSLANLAVVHDDVFSHAVTSWLPTRTRASIDDDGVVKDGHLFSEETVPPGALFWTPTQKDDRGILPQHAETWTLGGHQTIGAGRVMWCTHVEES